MTRLPGGLWWVVLGVFALDLASVQFLWMPPVVPQALTAIVIAGLVVAIARPRG